MGGLASSGQRIYEQPFAHHLLMWKALSATKYGLWAMCICFSVANNLYH